MFWTFSDSGSIDTSFCLNTCESLELGHPDQFSVFLKNKGHWSLIFWNLSQLSPRKHPNEQLSCFKFLPIRPLRTCKFHFSELPGVGPESSFGVSPNFTSLCVVLARPPNAGPTNTCTSSNVPHTHKILNPVFSDLSQSRDPLVHGFERKHTYHIVHSYHHTNPKTCF